MSNSPNPNDIGAPPLDPALFLLFVYLVDVGVGLMFGWFDVWCGLMFGGLVGWFGGGCYSSFFVWFCFAFY